jgi:hypothetical protein
MKSKGETQRVVRQGDAFELLSDVDVAHAAIVDYPWEFQMQNGSGRFEYRREPRHASDGDTAGARDLEHEDAMFDMEGDERLPELLEILADTLVEGAWVVFFADDRFQDPVRDALRNHDEFIFRRNWAWTPESMGMGYYGRIDHYPMPVATLGETDRHVTSRSTLYRVPGGRDTEYSTGKPVELYRQLLAEPVLRDGEKLLEPFCGSAPGAAVAVERDLEYWGCDVDDDALEIARERLEKTTVTDWFGVEPA